SDGSLADDQSVETTSRERRSRRGQLPEPVISPSPALEVISRRSQRGSWLSASATFLDRSPRRTDSRKGTARAQGSSRIGLYFTAFAMSRWAFASSALS